MPKKYIAYALFALAFMVNASFSLVTDYLIVHTGFIEQYVFYLVISGCIFIYVAVFKPIELNMIGFSIGFFLYLLTWSFAGDSVYGASKAFLGIMVPFLSVMILSLYAWRKDEVVEAVLVTCIFVLIVALIYKTMFGFSARSVRFGLFGSITFGWVMSFGAVTALLVLKEKRSFITFSLFFVFLIAVFWSGSKGPLVSLLLIVVYMIFRVFSFSRLFLFFTLTFVLVYFMRDFFFESRAISSLMEIAKDPEAYVAGAGQGSVGSRISFYRLSIALFMENPILGIGFGGWGSWEATTHHYYPHNLFLEIISESGLLGLLLLFVILARALKINNLQIKYLVAVSIIAMMFSGDFSYFRYPLFFILLSMILHRREKFLYE